MPKIAEPEEKDTRTYLAFVQEGFGGEFCSLCGSDCTCYVMDRDGEKVPAPRIVQPVTTTEVVVGHFNFPCPATRGQITCQEAWDNWLIHAPIRIRPQR